MTQCFFFSRPRHLLPFSLEYSSYFFVFESRGTSNCVNTMNKSGKIYSNFPNEKVIVVNSFTGCDVGSLSTDRSRISVRVCEMIHELSVEVSDRYWVETEVWITQTSKSSLFSGT